MPVLPTDNGEVNSDPADPLSGVVNRFARLFWLIGLSAYKVQRALAPSFHDVMG